MVQTTIRMPEKLYCQIKEQAKKRGVSVNSFIITILCEKKVIHAWKEMIKVQIGEKEYSEILITDVDGGLIASITDKDVIEEKNCKVVCVPIED